jgi:hypothetical protein
MDAGLGAKKRKQLRRRESKGGGAVRVRTTTTQSEYLKKEPETMHENQSQAQNPVVSKVSRIRGKSGYRESREKSQNEGQANQCQGSREEPDA